ncbi:cytochrome c551 peroxidase precursor [Pseudomonas sp. SCT]|uniref:Cytochrome-c peroxidase IdrP1 n=1 Tax=Pseudomonas sp. (strain SCT) TaxID=412955 RepID=IDRP1_PSEXS|nr:cytochrome c peroxidase [Pseudomonas sp. SCT]A0A391NGM7.1 RecName: Full=Cytochrome-c peroxidase IdrP1; AltName: Full=Iodate reductase subunit IdrP1; Flags: Precursor [Pseudomonas sp. SCT]GCA58263.1 cytochrome c551 peroxidase precursor [Pseudomonas sp. SCT]
MNNRKPLQLSLLVASLAVAFTASATNADAHPPLAPLPPVPVPKDNPQSAEKIALGKQLFWDYRLSGDGSMPCVSCHLPALGWGDGGQISRGYPGTKHWRNSQTILNSAYYNKLFWEGSVNSLEEQAPSAAEGAVAGNGDPSVMEMRLRFVPEYVDAFKNVFGSQWPRMNDAYRAIASYQRTVVSDASKVPFDRYANGDKNALDTSQKRGMALFNGKAGCVQCHNGPLASDQKYYDLGLPDFAGFVDDPLYQVTHRWEHYQKGVSEPRYRAANMDYGLYYVTKNPKDVGKFRTPSLREAKYTAPYMHNGVFTSLQEVVDFYDRGGGSGTSKSELLKPLKLAAQEKQDLIAFIEALSMSEPLLHDDPTLPGEYQPLPAPIK